MPSKRLATPLPLRLTSYTLKKYEEALKLYDLAFKDSKSETPEQIIKNRIMISRTAWIYKRLRKPSKASAMYKQCYEYSSDVVKKFPDNVEIAEAQISDLTFLANDYSKPQDASKKLALQLQAVTLADELATKHPKNQSVLLTQFNSAMNLAKSYRWSDSQRDETPPLVDAGLAILEKIEANSLMKGTTKESLAAQIMGLKVAVVMLSKDYETALKLNTTLLKKVEPNLVTSATSSYQISNHFNSFYNQALLHDR